MELRSIRLKGHRCFQKEWSGFESVFPINVIIGRVPKRLNF